MQLLTYLDCKNSRLPGVAAFCADSVDFGRILNKATRQLMIRGEFDGLVVKVQVCADNGCVVWPREVSTVLSAIVSGQTVQSRNGWFEFLPANGGEVRADKRCGKQIMEVDGQVPVFRNIRCTEDSEGLFLRVFLERDADVGKTITIYGLDSNGNELYTDRSDGTYLPGITMTLAKPYVQSPIRMRHITRVQKDATRGRVHLYSTNNVDGDMLQLGSYNPMDTNPMFRSTAFGSFRSMGCCACANGTKSILAYVKLQFLPVENDDDVVQIQNIDALEHMIRAIKFSDAYDTESAAKAEAAAIRELNLELGSTQPTEQISVKMSGFGTAQPKRHRIGYMI
jgi:hypothetical protein